MKLQNYLHNGLMVRVGHIKLPMLASCKHTSVLCLHRHNKLEYFTRMKLQNYLCNGLMFTLGHLE
jgi:hypothetical protein